MKCSVFIASSFDGYIATKSGGVDWLEKAGNQDADMGERSDMGFNDFIKSIDCIIMGRKSMEKISSFNLTPEQWPYGETPIIVLSHSLKNPPDNMKQVEMYSGEIPALLARLEEEGYQHAYIDGGTTISSFLDLKLIDEMTITQAPVLLGEGISLFGNTESIQLVDARVEAYPNDFVQVRYRLKYV